VARASMLQHRSRLGSCLEVELFGGVHGHIYGDVIYSDDSDVATAALHAGVLQANQSATIKVYITGPRRSFAKCVRNGIQSNKFHYWPGSFTFDEGIMRQVVAPKATAGSSSSSSGRACGVKKVCVRDKEDHGSSSSSGACDSTKVCVRDKEDRGSRSSSGARGVKKICVRGKEDHGSSSGSGACDNTQVCVRDKEEHAAIGDDDDIVTLAPFGP